MCPNIWTLQKWPNTNPNHNCAGGSNLIEVAGLRGFALQWLHSCAIVICMQNLFSPLPLPCNGFTRVLLLSLYETCFLYFHCPATASLVCYCRLFVELVFSTFFALQRPLSCTIVVSMWNLFSPLSLSCNSFTCVLLSSPCETFFLPFY